eukprot:gene12539-26415_t
MTVEDAEAGDNEPEEETETIIREVTAQQTGGQTVLQSTRLTSPVSKRTRSGGTGSGNEVTIKLTTLRQKLDPC